MFHSVTNLETRSNRKWASWNRMVFRLGRLAVRLTYPWLLLYNQTHRESYQLFRSQRTQRWVEKTWRTIPLLHEVSSEMPSWNNSGVERTICRNTYYKSLRFSRFSRVSNCRTERPRNSSKRLRRTDAVPTMHRERGHSHFAYMMESLDLREGISKQRSGGKKKSLYCSHNALQRCTAMYFN